jgi:FKBP-type peptidyl-prolyl cis-trans isomerase
MKRMALILIACLGLVGAGCGGGSSGDGDPTGSSESTAAANTASTEATGTEATTTESNLGPKDLTPDPSKIETDKKEPKVTVPKGVSTAKLTFRDLEEGTGAEAKSGDTLTVHYVGLGFKSKSKFESTWEDKPYTFVLGGGEVLPGLEQGVEGMKAEGRREIVVPPKLGYGAEGVQPAIGPNEALVYVVDLLAVE